jgi:hypothetical protein
MAGLGDTLRSAAATADQMDATMQQQADAITAKDAQIADLQRQLEETQNPAPAPLVRSVNWWCADGMRDGKRVLHHLEEFGADSPEVTAYRALTQRTTGTEYSFDTSALGNDANRPEDVKINSHKVLFGVTRVRNLRVFFGSAPPTWTGKEIEHRRIAALKPGDSLLFSSLSTNWAAWSEFLHNTPDHLRGAVLGCFGHEREANLDRGPKLKAWLAANDRMFDTFDAAEAYGYVTDEHAGKIGLFYSQEIDKKSGVSIPNREDLYGGQDRGWFGEDVYNPRASKTYWSPERLFGPIIAFTKEIGRPCRIPEWGGERVDSDKTGEGRARWITDCAAYLEAANA